MCVDVNCVLFFSSRRRHTRLTCDWSSDVCSSDLGETAKGGFICQPAFQRQRQRAEFSPGSRSLLPDAGGSALDQCARGGRRGGLVRRKQTQRKEYVSRL